MKTEQIRFDRIWELILKYFSQHQLDVSLTPEVMACIFWEESGYRLVKNEQGSSASGLGQIIDGTREAINKEYGTKFTAKDLFELEKSVEASVLLLKLCWKSRRNKERALQLYAGYDPNWDQNHKAPKDQKDPKFQAKMHKYHQLRRTN